MNQPLITSVLLLLAACRTAAPTPTLPGIEGWLVVDPTHEGSVWLARDGAEDLCLSMRASNGLELFADQRVIAYLHPSDPPKRKCDAWVVDSVGLATGEPPPLIASAKPQLVKTHGALMARTHRWVLAVGAFIWLEPPFGGGYFWKGTLRLADGTEVKVTSIPAELVSAFRAPEVRVTALARVDETGGLKVKFVCKEEVERCGVDTD